MTENQIKEKICSKMNISQNQISWFCPHTQIFNTPEGQFRFTIVNNDILISSTIVLD
jgi:hypothetical protein